jgi:transposase
METFTMSRKEVPRAGLVHAALVGRITNQQGATALRLSVRQFQRLKHRYQRDGPRGLAHRSRGRPSPRRLPVDLRQRIADLILTAYPGLNDVHLTEKLQEEQHLAISRNSVRRLRRAMGRPPSRRRRPRPHRGRRPREAASGTLIQIDGSPFEWLEERGPGMTLVGAIDDATSQLLALHFRPTEDLHGYAVVFRQVFTAYGLPLAVYGDRLNILVRNDHHWSLEEELHGAQHPTHLGRILQELGIGYIQAHSPQAKGRVERLWQTLQDRLVSELRLRGIATLEAANAYLPTFLADYNRRFTCPPADPTAVWRRPPRELDRLLSCRYSRIVAHDNTVRLGPRWMQIPPGPGGRSYVGCRVEVRELLDGRLLALHQERDLATLPTPGPDFILRPRSAPSAQRRPRPRIAVRTPSAPRAQRPRSPGGPPSSTPALTHPWRTAFSPRRRALEAAIRRG